MTCEVAVMNKRGVALATDSAVTLGNGDKIYQTAEKLFQLSSVAPVGVMTYGSADMMGVPWETVVKIYTQKANRKFDQLENYAQDFLHFIETAEFLFPEAAQRRWFQSLVRAYWKGQVLDPMQKRFSAEPKKMGKRANAVLSELIDADLEDWKRYKVVEALGSAYGDKVLTDYGPLLDELEKEVFPSLQLSDQVRQGLRNIVRYMYTYKWFHPDDLSGIVVAGMGEAEPFPVLVHYHVGTVAAGRLRWVKIDEARVNHEDDAIVVPLAQRQVIDMFYRGIFPALEEKLFEMIGKSLRVAISGKKNDAVAAVMEKVEKSVRDALDQEVQEKYIRPLIAAVGALPRYELAKLAEALVNLTAFRARMSAAEDETVGGPIDIAVISKGDGFVWVKRKDLVRGVVEGMETLVSR